MSHDPARILSAADVTACRIQISPAGARRRYDAGLR
jgi:hypothetical protein